MKTRSVLAVLVVAACSHGEPFSVPSAGTDQPLRPGQPAQLTFSPVLDSEAAWLPDGSGLLYSALRPDFPDTTFCLELLPPDGGQARRSWCPVGAPKPDSARAFQASAVSPGGRLVYLRSARTSPNLGWSVRQLVLTSMDGRDLPHAILSSPFPQYTGLSQIRWLDESRLVFRADFYFIQFPCRGCPPIEGSTGLFLVVADLSGGTPTFTTVPGTAGATSVAVQDSGTIVYTLAGDSLVYRRNLATGAVDVLWNFGPGVADAVQLAGPRLAATVGGSIRIVDLGAGTVSTVDPSTYDGLALSPDGHRLAGQRFGDLWLWHLP